MNVAPNLGGSLGIAAMQTVITLGSTAHGEVLKAQLDPTNPSIARLAAALAARLGAPPLGPAALSIPGVEAALQSLMREAQMLAYIDAFRVLAIIAAIFVPFALLLRNIDLGRKA